MSHYSGDCKLSGASVIIVILLVVVGLCSLKAGAEQSGELRSELERLGEVVTKRLFERATRWRCEPAKAFVCSSENCQEVRPPIWVNLDFAARSYQRCDSKGCDTHPMTPATSGIHDFFHAYRIEELLLRKDWPAPSS